MRRRYNAVPDLYCSPALLNQVVMNIVGNAADAIKGTGGIDIETESNETTYTIRISDTGPGIPEVRERIFEPFFTTKPVGSGTGLGLAIAYSVVQAHKGSIAVDWGPRGRQLHPHDPEADCFMTLSSEMNSTNGTILVVDDEPDILIALEDLFENDYRVLTACVAGQGARHHSAGADIAIIISDQRMPEMQGDEFLAKARHVDADAILLTGYADLKAVIGAVNKGRIMAYVPKPWDPAALSNMVAAAYQRRMLARRLDTERALLRGLMEARAT